MKYTLEQRLEIGRRIYENEISRYEAAEEYGIDFNSARDYMRLFRDTNHLPPKNLNKPLKNKTAGASKYAQLHDTEAYGSMTRQELIQELIMAKKTIAQLKNECEMKSSPRKE